MTFIYKPLLTFISIIVLGSLIFEPEHRVLNLLVPGIIFAIPFTLLNQPLQDRGLRKIALNSLVANMALIMGIVFGLTFIQLFSNDYPLVLAACFGIGCPLAIIILFSAINRVGREVAVTALVLSMILAIGDELLKAELLQITIATKLTIWLAFIGSVLSYGINKANQLTHQTSTTTESHIA